VGFEAGKAITSSQRNVAVGYQALLVHTTGNRNTGVGDGAGIAISTGANNTCLGNAAGYNITSGDNNLALGYGVTVATADIDNQLSIGNWIKGLDGQITMPSQPAFLAHAADMQNNIAINTAVTVVLGTEVFDIGANFASNTFTAPVTGKYQLNVCLRIHDIDQSQDYMYIKIITSNRNYTKIQSPEPFDADHEMYSKSITALADMDAGDTAYVILYQAAGATQMDIHGSSDGHSYFSGFLAC
jgi:hypothetical protein